MIAREKGLVDLGRINFFSKIIILGREVDNYLDPKRK